MNIKNIALGTGSYIASSFLIQALSHFVINKDHYASISFLRAEPLMYFGLLTMLIQGVVLTTLYLTWAKTKFSVNQGLKFAWLMGLFFVSYLALVEPDKYMVTNISRWIMVEGTAGFFQFTIFGLLLGRFVKN